MGETVHSDGARVAVRATGRTAEGAQLDDGLVVAAGGRLVQEGLPQVPGGAGATGRIDGLRRAEEGAPPPGDNAGPRGGRGGGGGKRKGKGGSNTP